MSEQQAGAVCLTPLQPSHSLLATPPVLIQPHPSHVVLG